MAPGPCVTTGGPGSFRGGPPAGTLIVAVPGGRSWGLQRPGGRGHSGGRPIHRHPHRGSAGSFVGTATIGWWLAFQPARPALQASGRRVGGTAIVRVCNDPGPAMIPAHGCARSPPTNTHQRTNHPCPPEPRRPDRPSPSDPLGFTEVGLSRTPGHPDFMKPESITNERTAQSRKVDKVPPWNRTRAGRGSTRRRGTSACRRMSTSAGRARTDDGWGLALDIGRTAVCRRRHRRAGPDRRRPDNTALAGRRLNRLAPVGVFRRAPA